MIYGLPQLRGTRHIQHCFILPCERCISTILPLGGRTHGHLLALQGQVTLIQIAGIAANQSIADNKGWWHWQPHGCETRQAIGLATHGRITDLLQAENIRVQSQAPPWSAPFQFLFIKAIFSAKPREYQNRVHALIGHSGEALTGRQ